MPNSRASNVHVRSIPMTDAMWEQLAADAEAAETSKAEVARQAIEHYQTCPNRPK